MKFKKWLASTLAAVFVFTLIGTGSAFAWYEATIHIPKRVVLVYNNPPGHREYSIDKSNLRRWKQVCHATDCEPKSANTCLTKKVAPSAWLTVIKQM